MTKIQDLVNQIDTLVQALKLEVATDGVPVASALQLTSALLTGGTISLAAGTYTGNFRITKPTTLTGPSSAILAPFDPLTPTLLITGSDVAVTGISIVNGAPDRDCVIVGDFNATDAATQPNRVTFDNVTITAGPKGGHRGVALHGQNLTVRNCRITNFWESGRDSQAVWMHNGPGPYTVENNFLSASGETILVGGDSIKIPGCVPADILIRGNTCFKPDTWRTNGATVKNGIEIKVGRRVLIENNAVNGCWPSGQNGTPILLTPRNQNGDSPWVVVDDVIVRGNSTTRCTSGFGLSILGHDDLHPSGQTLSVMVEHNLFTDSPNGIQIGGGVLKALVIRNNTFPAITGSIIKFYGAITPRSPLTFTANVARSGDYGFTGDNTTVGLPSLLTYSLVQAFTDNIIETTTARTLSYPVGTEILAAGQLAARLNPTTFKLLNGTAGY